MSLQPAGPAAIQGVLPFQACLIVLNMLRVALDPPQTLAEKQSNNGQLKPGTLLTHSPSTTLTHLHQAAATALPPWAPPPLASRKPMQAGAKHVYAVDASPGAADMARKVIAANGLQDKITVLTGRAELLELPVRRVDVVLCDWMGSMLLHDSLLPALIRIRDRWGH